MYPELCNPVTKSWFVEIYSKQHTSQTVRAKELNFRENLHPTPCVMSHVPCVTCHVSHVTFFVWRKTNYKKMRETNIWKIGLRGGASQWRVFFLSTGPTPSSFSTVIFHSFVVYKNIVITSAYLSIGWITSGWPTHPTLLIFPGKIYSIPKCFHRSGRILFNRPGIAGAVLQTPLSLINLLSQWSFVKIY